jgi:hypothetical protein
MLVLSVSHGLPVCKLQLARIKLRVSDHQTSSHSRSEDKHGRLTVFGKAVFNAASAPTVSTPQSLNA